MTKFLQFSPLSFSYINMCSCLHEDIASVRLLKRHKSWKGIKDGGITESGSESRHAWCLVSLSQPRGNDLAWLPECSTCVCLLSKPPCLLSSHISSQINHLAKCLHTMIMKHMSLATGRGNTHPEVSPRQQYPLPHTSHTHSLTRRVLFIN